MIEVDKLTKRYGSRIAVEDVSFTASPGKILGFLGANGAGKTTTMRIVTGYMPATGGSVRVCGFDVAQQPMEVKRRVGYLPENPPLYNDMAVQPYLEHAGRLKGMSRGAISAALDSVLKACGLVDVTRRLNQHLSKGYRQRVGIAQALLNDPEVLILDEPTIGLDPRQIRDIRELMKTIGRTRTLVFSTHNLWEVEHVCDQVVIINLGRKVLSGDLRDVTKGRTLEEVFLEAVSHDAPRAPAPPHR